MNRMIGMAAAALLCLSSVAMAENRIVTVHNRTDSTLLSLYGSNRDASGWEEDIMGPDLLLSGETVDVNFDDSSGYCIFDLRATFDDGSEAVKYGVDVCAISDFYFND